VQARVSEPAISAGVFRLSMVAPIVMSLLALTICAVGKANLFPQLEPPGDEGTMAHRYQVIMAGQVPIIVVFFVAVARRGWRQHWRAIGLQVALFVLAALAVPILGL